MLLTLTKNLGKKTNMKKQNIIQTSVNDKLLQFYEELSEIEESKAYWFRLVLTKFAKEYNWNADKAINEQFQG